MKHTSIRLSEEHAARIEQSGQSPTIIIKKALDLYFDIPPDNLEPARRLIEEHVRLCHSPAHNVPIAARPEHVVSTSPEARPILEEIMKDLEANREPMLSELADRFKVPAQTISKSLSSCGIKAQETKRAGVAGRYFTFAMRPQIEEILGKV